MKTKPIQKTVLLSLLMAIVITCGKSDIDTPEAPIEDEVTLDPPVVTPSPYVNLNSSISFSATETVNEGDYVQFTIELGTQLSEPLPINLAFNSDSLVNVLNPEDYSTVLGYSSDNGTTWSQAQNNTINIPEETSTLFIRFDTHDDNKLEVHEAVYVQLEAQPQNDVVLSNTASSTFKITVLDNEDNGDDFFGGFMTFTVDDAYKLSLNSVARTVSTTQEKAFIDQGNLQTELINDIQYALKSGGISTHYFIAKYEPEGNLGSVYNLGNQQESDEWVLNMNLYYAYNDIDGENAISYNENGYFGNTLIHEKGHILTLNETYQKDLSITSMEDCQHHFEEDYGCMKEDATFSTFAKAFYNGQDPGDFGFVTSYAETSISEDIAETFMYYVAQDSIPKPGAFSIVALQKINFIKNEKWLSPFKYLKDSIYLNLNTELGPIYFKRHHRQKFKSCLETGRLEREYYLQRKGMAF